MITPSGHGSRSESQVLIASALLEWTKTEGLSPEREVTVDLVSPGERGRGLG